MPIGPSELPNSAITIRNACAWQNRQRKINGLFSLVRRVFFSQHLSKKSGNTARETVFQRASPCSDLIWAYWPFLRSHKCLIELSEVLALKSHTINSESLHLAFLVPKSFQVNSFYNSKF